jgi:hypothetical protein
VQPTRRSSPGPPELIKKLIGDLSDSERVLVDLQLLMPDGW